MAEELTKQKAKELMKAEGEARGVTIKTDWGYVKDSYGKNVLKEIEEKMAELGYPLKYEEIRTMDFYPIGMDTLSMLVIQEVLGFEEEDMIRIGAEAIKFSIFLKIILRHFSSMSLFTKEAPRMWKKHYTVGELKVTEADPKNNRYVIEISDFKVHPVYCPTIIGYFSEIGRMITGGKVKVWEEECVFEQGKVHRFIIEAEEE